MAANGDALRLSVVVDTSGVGPAFANVKSQVDSISSGLNVAGASGTASGEKIAAWSMSPGSIRTIMWKKRNPRSTRSMMVTVQRMTVIAVSSDTKTNRRMDEVSDKGGCQTTGGIPNRWMP